MRGLRVIVAVVMTLPGLARAEEAELPEFQVCMNAEVARYEREIAQAWAAERMDLYRVDGVEFCGTVGIVRCDRSEAPLDCQRALAVEQDILRARVLDQLPEPVPDPTPEAFLPRLYEMAHALAHGMSAGQDCAGAEPVIEMWCRAREANGRLRAAMLAWQVARHMGQVPPAVEAGWADAPEPLRPKAREEAKK